MLSRQNLFIKGQTSELALVTSSNKFIVSRNCYRTGAYEVHSIKLGFRSGITVVRISEGVDCRI